MSLSATMRERRSAKKASLDALVAAAETRDDKSFTDDESTQFDALVTEIRAMDDRIVELEAVEATEARAAETRKVAGEGGEQRTGGAQVTDAPVYVKGNVNGNSYFRDMGKRALAQGGADVSGVREATERLVRNGRMAADESRAIGNTNTTGGSGGEFAPPTWLVNEWINLLRPGRVTADLLRKGPVPDGTSSISIPKLTGGTAVALQTTQNSTVTATDITTSYVSTGFMTILGKEVVSQQLLDQSALPLDEVISSDLAAAYNAYFGAQIYAGTGSGANNNAVLNGLNNAAVIAANQSTFTSASPTAALFYSKANGMLSNFVSNRFAPPTHWLMHPRRWYWLLAQTDSNGRPLVVPNDVAYNPMATDAGVANVQGTVGRFLGLPVVLDPNISTNLGAGTNQDEVFLIKADDLWLFESTPRAEAFTAPYAESLGVLFRLYNYAGTILNRLSSSIATMNGTGLVAPTF
jgi:HK97 family phage major capsid protein